MCCTIAECGCRRPCFSLSTYKAKVWCSSTNSGVARKVSFSFMRQKFSFRIKWHKSEVGGWRQGCLSLCRLWSQSTGDLLNASVRQKFNSVTVIYLLWRLLCEHCFSSELCIVFLMHPTMHHHQQIHCHHYWAASGVNFLPCVQV